MKTFLPAQFKIIRYPERCIKCRVCANQCTSDTHYYDTDDEEVMSRLENCNGCHRCVTFCPTDALTVTKNQLNYRDNYNWTPEAIEDILSQQFTKLCPRWLRPYGKLYTY